jgi:hypothetical protein
MQKRSIDIVRCTGMGRCQWQLGAFLPPGSGGECFPESRIYYSSFWKANVRWPKTCGQIWRPGAILLNGPLWTIWALKPRLPELIEEPIFIQCEFVILRHKGSQSVSQFKFTGLAEIAAVAGQEQSGGQSINNPKTMNCRLSSPGSRWGSTRTLQKVTKVKVSKLYLVWQSWVHHKWVPVPPGPAGHPQGCSTGQHTPTGRRPPIKKKKYTYTLLYTVHIRYTVRRVFSFFLFFLKSKANRTLQTYNFFLLQNLFFF